MKGVAVRVAAAACALAVVLSAVPVRVLGAEPEVVVPEYTIENVKEQLDQAAHFQLIEQKMARCLAGTGVLNQYDLGLTAASKSTTNQVYEGHLFKNGFQGVVASPGRDSLFSFWEPDVATGYYLEDALTKGTDGTNDGAFDCGQGDGVEYKDNALFATYANWLVEAGGILDGSGQPIVEGTQYQQILDSLGYVDEECVATILHFMTGAYGSCYRVSDAWQYAFESFHYQYKQKMNPYLVDYENLQYFSGGGDEDVTPDNVAYFLLAKEISVFCSGNDGGDALIDSGAFEVEDGGEAYDTKLRYVNTDNGSIEEISVKKGGVGSDGMRQANSFGAKTRTCEELIADTSALAEAVQEEYRKAKIEMCRAETLTYMAAKWAEPEAPGDLTQQEILADIEVLNERVAAMGEEGYVTGDANTGWECSVDAIEEKEYESGGEHNNSTGIYNWMKECQATAGVFGWIACPLLEDMYQMVEGTFEAIEEFLRVNPVILDADEEDGGAVLMVGWTVFRDVANVVLVVLFIMIIVSQVTGYGIDNYGIKRMLPRLIVVGILINLSFIVCQLAVDLSNIVGGNIYGLFRGLADNIGFSATGGKAAGLGLTAVFVAIFGVIIVAIINPVILLPILIAMLGAVISIMFMFLLLGVRQAAVAVLVVVAPVAFVANILPNTQPLFKRWWNILKTLLILYPICGLVMGAGYYGSRLLMAINPEQTSDGNGEILGFVFAIVALVILFAPVFFIPKLTKGAFDGLGKIGGAIAGLGGRFSGFARGKLDGAVRNSDRLKLAQENRLSRKNDRLIDRLSNRQASGKTLSASQKQRLARAQAAQLKSMKEEGNVEAATRPGVYAARQQELRDSQLDADVAVQYSTLSKDPALGDMLANTTKGTDIERAAATAEISRRWDSLDDAGRFAMMNVMSETSYGRQALRGLLDEKTRGMTPEARTNFNRAAQRQKSFQNLDKKAEDIADFLRNPTARTVGGAAQNLKVSAGTVAGWDKETLANVAAARSQVGVNGERTTDAAFRTALQSALDDQTVMSNSKIANEIRATATSFGITPTAAGGRSVGAPVARAAAAPASRAVPVAGVPARADVLNAGTGNVRGGAAGENGGKFIVQGPDAGREQTDSGIIIARE